MKKYSEDELIKIHKQSFQNSRRILRANDCGCFYCLEHFQPVEVQFVDDTNGKTAICPKCGIDSVIGSNARIDDDLLVALKKRFF